jgi:hypothetical protein
MPHRLKIYHSAFDVNIKLIIIAVLSNDNDANIKNEIKFKKFEYYI